MQATRLTVGDLRPGQTFSLHGLENFGNRYTVAEIGRPLVVPKIGEVVVIHGYRITSIDSGREVYNVTLRI